MGFAVIRNITTHIVAGFSAYSLQLYFGILSIAFLKGANHLLDLGTEYLIINLTLITASAVAIITPNERYHKVFATVWIIVFTGFMFRTFFVIS